MATTAEARTQHPAMFAAQLAELRAVDPEIARAVEAERRRQEENVVLIASENVVSIFPGQSTPARDLIRAGRRS